MKRIEGHASSVVAAPVDRSFALLAAVHRYPDWHGQVIRAVDVLDRDRDGRPVRARAMIHVAHSPFGVT